jgi:hypothetical protein
VRALVEQGPVGDAPATFDLIAHTTRDHKLLRGGTDVLDMFKPAVRAFFERLAVDGVLDARGSYKCACSAARARPGQAAAGRSSG